MTERKHQFRTGETVTVHTSQGGPQSQATIERFEHGGRCIVLSDGTEWRLDGQRPWRHGSGYYRGPVVHPAQPGDADHIAKRRAIGRLHKWSQGLTMDTPLPAAALLRVLDLIRAETAAAGDGSGEALTSDDRRSDGSAP